MFLIQDHINVYDVLYFSEITFLQVFMIMNTLVYIVHVCCPL
jgi:hypothetical protein